MGKINLADVNPDGAYVYGYEVVIRGEDHTKINPFDKYSDLFASFEEGKNDAIADLRERKQQKDANFHKWCPLCGELLDTYPNTTDKYCSNKHCYYVFTGPKSGDKMERTLELTEKEIEAKYE